MANARQNVANRSSAGARRRNRSTWVIEVTGGNRGPAKWSYHDPQARPRSKPGIDLPKVSKIQQDRVLFRRVNTLSKVLATAFGAGYSPIAPGTCGTAVAVPIAWVTSALPVWQFVALAAVVT